MFFVYGCPFAIGCNVVCNINLVLNQHKDVGRQILCKECNKVEMKPDNINRDCVPWINYYIHVNYQS